MNSTSKATRDKEAGRLATMLTMAVLVAANTAPIIGVLFFDWKVFEVLALFWVENVFIGVINLLRMATILVLRGRIETIFLMPFFCVHYGMFTIVHGVFVMSMFGPKDADGNSLFDQAGGDPFDDPLGTFLPMFHDLYWAAAALFLSHFVSYLVHFLARGEYRDTDGGELMAKPYGRVVILHVTILLGGGIALATGESIYALIMLVLLKICIDIAAHRKQHDEDKKKGKARRAGFKFGPEWRNGGVVPQFAAGDVGAAAANGFTIAALKPHPKFVEMPPWAQVIFKHLGRMMNIDASGADARGNVHKYLRSMTVKGAMLPESLTQRIQNLGIRGGTTLKLLLDDDTVIGYDYFANKIDVNGPRAGDARNIAAAVAMAECIDGFQSGVRIKASAQPLESDLSDSLNASPLRITR